MTSWSILHVLPTREELSQAAASRVAELSAQSTREGRCFRVALSGGSLLDILSPPLVTDPLRSCIPWAGWEVFWADERCVSLDNAQSNYAAAKKVLLDQVPIPKEQMHTLGQDLEPCAAALAYQARLEEVFQPEPGQLPRFDLILLGMGQDGHTASLFPGHELLREDQRWVAPVHDAPKPPAHRITLTLPVINQAQEVIFVVAGQDKAAALQTVFAAKGMGQGLPAALVKPERGPVHWFVDQAAARKVR